MRTTLCGLVVLLAARAASAQFINDHFHGDRLDNRWAWVSEDECTGSVDDALVLNPVAVFRQAAIGTVGGRYTWAAAGNPRTHQFTVGAWQLAVTSDVSVRLFLVGDEAGAQPKAFSDYNQPNVLMGALEVEQGAFTWNLYAKTGIINAQVDQDAYRLARMAVASNVQGCTFGLTLERGQGRLWWQDALGRMANGTNVPVPSYAFKRKAHVYVGAKNDTRDVFSPGQTVSISHVRVGP